MNAPKEPRVTAGFRKANSSSTSRRKACGSRAGLTRGLLIAASGRAHASRSLDGDGPAAAMAASSIITTMIMLTVAGPTKVNANTVGTNVHALSGGRWSRRGPDLHCAQGVPCADAC